MECDLSKNKQSCTCTYNCDKKGKCCECVSYHNSRAELPGCFFTPEVERMYDRSREAYIRTYSK